MKETLKYHSTTQSQLSFRDIRSVQLESIKHCEGISPASVQMKLTASALEEQQWDMTCHTARVWHNDFHVVICEFFWPVCQKHPSVAPVLTAQHRASWLAFAREHHKYFRASQIFFCTSG